MLEVKEKWTVKRSDGAGTRSRCMALCDCGDYSEYDYDNVRRGNTSRCKDCAHKARVERGRKKRKHGLVGASKSEGGKIYYTWKAMKARCGNENNSHYRFYGGKGIIVCERWQSFCNFRLDMGEPPTNEHTIERIDFNKNYCPENCRWATTKEQANNKTNNHKITINGETKNLCQWAEQLGIKAPTIRGRIKRGWSESDAVLTPVGKKPAKC